MLLAEYAGRRPGGFENNVKLAELVGAGCWDIANALNFPNKHPLSISMDKGALKGVDLVLGLDIKDWEKATHELNSTDRKITPLVNADADWVEIGFAELGISKWSMDYCRMQPCSVRALGDTALGVPALIAVAGEAHRRRREAAEEDRRPQGRDRQAPRRDVGEVAGRIPQGLGLQAPMTTGRLAHEVWDVIKDEDWVLTANTLKHGVRKVWDFDKPYRHPGIELGTSTQIGMSIGVALAHKKHGRLVVDLQPDGDLMFDAGALWMLAKYEIPMLIVMYNNRAYYNDWEHQIRMARLRGTDIEKAHIGMDLFGPEPDFGALARSMGVWGEGPIEDPKDVRGALGARAQGREIRQAGAHRHRHDAPLKKRTGNKKARPKGRAFPFVSVRDQTMTLVMMPFGKMSSGFTCLCAMPCW